MLGEELPVPPFVCLTKAQCGVAVPQRSRGVRCGSLRALCPGAECDPWLLSGSPRPCASPDTAQSPSGS